MGKAIFIWLVAMLLALLLIAGMVVVNLPLTGMLVAALGFTMCLAAVPLYLLIAYGEELWND